MSNSAKQSISIEHIQALCPNLGEMLESIRPGKKLRGKMVVTSCELIQVENLKHRDLLAQAVEELHAATLIHDDIIDNSCERRNKPSLHMQFNNSQAVLAGDYLYGKAFQKIALIANTAITSCIANATTDIIEGEFLQLQAINDRVDSKEFYFQVIERKTARLFQICTETACILSGRPNHTFKLFGHHYGMAYQMYDDLQDYLGKPESLGKALGNDFHEGKMTLPLINALKNSQQEPCIMQTMSFDTAKQFISDHNGFSDSVAIITNEINKAFLCLVGFQDSSAKAELILMLNTLKDKTYSLLEQ